MDRFAIDALTGVDVLVVFALLLIAAAMWAARRFVGVLLKFLPICVALLGTFGSYELYRLGEHMNWDSPGSAGILVVMFALGLSILMAIAGWIAVARQLRRLRKPGPPQSATRKATLNNLQVGAAIVFVVWALFSSYRYYRSHVPSHDATIQQMVFSPDGAFLYSLDQAGVLKKWNMAYRFEAQRWRLPDEGDASKLLVSGDGQTLVTLRDVELTAWRLGADQEAQRVFAAPSVRSVAAVDGDTFILLTESELSLHAYAEPAQKLAARTLRSPALAVSGYTDHHIVVSTEGPALEFYRVTPASLEDVEVRAPALEIRPMSMRADSTGQFLVVSDTESRMAILDLQNVQVDAVPDSFFTNTFEVSRQKQLLLAQIGITGYDLPSRSSHPLFNHGGLVRAMAISPTDVLAIADRNAIWVRTDTRSYADPEVWLNGRVRLARSRSESARGR